MRILHFLIFLICSLWSTMSMAIDQGVVAVVDKEVIADADLHNRINLVIAMTGMNNSSATREAIEPQILQDLIDEKLVDKAALKYKIQIDAAEVKRAIVYMAAANKMANAIQLYDYVKARGGKAEEFEKQTRYQMLQSRMLKMVIEPMTSLSDMEVQEAKNQVIREAKAQSNNVQYKLSEIVIFPDAPDADMIIKELQAQLALGADFAMLAAEFSQSATSERGGEVGWMMESQLPREIVKAVSTTVIGKIIAPVLTRNGYFILKVLDKKVSNVNSEALSSEQIKDVLWNKKITLQWQAYMKKLRQQAFIKIRS